jgi:hypothetical protein
MDRFDLEEAIMACWSTAEDISLLVEKSTELSDDELLNGLVGLKSLHNLRCEKAFNILEELIAYGAI